MSRPILFALIGFLHNLLYGASSLEIPLVFVSRQIPPNGTVYWDRPKGMPGVGPYSRFQVCAPGQLIVREAAGQLRVLIDGARPTAESMQLVDVNAPEVSYDGREIVFAGVPAGEYSRSPMNIPGAWRIYSIRADGTGLRQITRSDRVRDFPELGDRSRLFEQYDDTDPVWLPDGRIVFSSTRYPAFGMYGGARASNLFVVNADGTDPRRITTERNGADRPLVDPLTGRIVFSRWWRNFRMATDSTSTVAHPFEGYIQKDGLIAANELGNPKLGGVPGGLANLTRNAWHLASINPDGTGLSQWAGVSTLFETGETANHAYGGSFAPDGSFYANFFPMKNLTEACGFGGIRQYQRGPGMYRPVIGLTTPYGAKFASLDPISYGVFEGAYAAEPEVLPNGGLVISWARDVEQDYGLYLVDSDGSNRTLLLDLAGTTELRPRLLRARVKPPIIRDTVVEAARPGPPGGQDPFDRDGTFTFKALNVYFNAPVDSDILTAIPVGSAGTIRFFADHQRDQFGSLENLDWPILLKELSVNVDGSIPPVTLPANLPLFEQIRSPRPGYRVPLTGRGHRGDLPGAAHVAGLNHGRPGAMATCVGCHAGHTMIPVPSREEDALWSNLAPGARVTLSSFHPNPYIDHTGEGLVDRRVLKGEFIDYWRSDPRQDAEQQWVGLTFPVSVWVRAVRVYNPRKDPELSIRVTKARIRLYRDSLGTEELARQELGEIAVGGTEALFGDLKARSVRIEIMGVSGLFQNERVASLAEVEVIARAAESVVPAPTRLEIHRHAPSGFVLGWTGELGRQYSLEFSGGLGGGAWSVLGEHPGEGRPISVIDPRVGAAGFYRVFSTGNP